ncbi:hypothetical protein [Sphingobacterium sp. 1.A.5]|uniref:hypothetical protein n=1 Tax=Sphingobacterium sp. 1.A.5 TaxID=2044604 RepID=UPI000C0BE3EF|nr:hypothetical protein [Sphingobacterium sp. 1.A.5]
MDFTDYENLGRRRLSMVYPTINWSFTEDPNCSFDAYAQHNNRLILAEVKNRNFSSKIYKTCFLEVNKAVSNLSYPEVDTVLYVVHYSDNITCTWNLTKMDLGEDLQIVEEVMNEKTVHQNGKVKKEIYHLNLSDADQRVTSTGLKIK